MRRYMFVISGETWTRLNIISNQFPFQFVQPLSLLRRALVWALRQSTFYWKRNKEQGLVRDRLQNNKLNDLHGRGSERIRMQECHRLWHSATSPGVSNRHVRGTSCIPIWEANCKSRCHSAHWGSRSANIRQPWPKQLHLFTLSVFKRLNCRPQHLKANRLIIQKISPIIFKQLYEDNSIQTSKVFAHVFNHHIV